MSLSRANRQRNIETSYQPIAVRRIKKRPLDELAPLMLPEQPRGVVGPPLVWAELFGNTNPVEIEVGFGKGLFLLTAGQACPNVNFLGIEIVRKYQLLAATRLLDRGLTNVRVACADAGVVLRERVPPQSVAAVHVFFPDPWWKARHKKRRVFTEAFAHSVARLLQTTGRFHIVTDVEEYFGVMVGIVHAMGPVFREVPPPPPTDAKHDMDYLTNFERRFRKQGLPIYRAMFERTDANLSTPRAASDTPSA